MQLPLRAVLKGPGTIIRLHLPLPRFPLLGIVKQPDEPRWRDGRDRVKSGHQW